MIYAVIGVGPRSGTSFVMHKLEEAGLSMFYDPDIYEPDEDNPHGYYECDPVAVQEQDGVVAKMWPSPIINQVGIARAVVLRRFDRDAQLKSIKGRMAVEKEACDRLGLSAEQYIDIPESIVNAGLMFEHRTFFTENLDSSIDEIIEYMSEPKTRSIN